MAGALGLSAPASLLVAGIVSLGATIAGPAVLRSRSSRTPAVFRGAAAIPGHRTGRAQALFRRRHRRLCRVPDAPAHGCPVLGCVHAVAYSNVGQASTPARGLQTPRGLHPFVPCLYPPGDIRPSPARRIRTAALLLPHLSSRRKPATPARPLFLDLGMVARLASLLSRPVCGIPTAYTRLRKKPCALCASSCSGLPLLGILSIPVSYVLLEK